MEWEICGWIGRINSLEKIAEKIQGKMIEITEKEGGNAKIY